MSIILLQGIPSTDNSFCHPIKYIFWNANATEIITWMVRDAIFLEKKKKR